MNNEFGDKKNPEEKNSSAENKNQSFFGEMFRFALLAFLIVVPIRIFIAQPFIVSGASMSPTFESGEYLIIDEISYRFNEPQRGEVVVFKFPEDTSKFFIKRIVGLPGENVRISNGEVFIKKELGSEEIKLEEVYVINKSFDDSSLQLGEDEYFVMGDNRSASLDSRNWGALQRDLVRGRAFLRLLPLNKAGVSPGFEKDNL